MLRGLSSTGGTSAAIEQLRGRGRKGKERSIRAPVWRSRCCRPLSSGEGLNIERSRLARPPRERSSVPIPSTLSLPPPSSPFAPRSARAAHPSRRQRAGVTTQTRQYVISLAPLPRHAITLVPMLFTPLRPPNPASPCLPLREIPRPGGSTGATTDDLAHPRPFHGFRTTPSLAVLRFSCFRSTPVPRGNATARDGAYATTDAQPTRVCVLSHSRGLEVTAI